MPEMPEPMDFTRLQVPSGPALKACTAARGIFKFPEGERSGGEASLQMADEVPVGDGVLIGP